MDTTVEETLRGVRDSLTVKRVFGDPIEKNGVTVVPVAVVFGGGGGGQGENPGGEGPSSGFGTGFGMRARPAGAYVIRGEDVSWQPAVDVNRLAIGALAYLVLRLLLRRR